MTNPEEFSRLADMLHFENQAYASGFKYPVGIDEAGRGPLAGPVVAAACILPVGFYLPGLNDSKQLSGKKREVLFQKLKESPGVYYGIGIVHELQIDEINIFEATKLAMRQAVDEMPISADCLLVDGLYLEHRGLASQKIIKGDQLSQSIAAASIIAKETRDALMLEYHKQWPSYGFDKHKGYGTAMHLAALKKYGPCSIHRFSFQPIKSLTS